MDLFKKDLAGPMQTLQTKAPNISSIEEVVEGVQYVVFQLESAWATLKHVKASYIVTTLEKYTSYWWVLCWANSEVSSSFTT